MDVFIIFLSVSVIVILVIFLDMVVHEMGHGIAALLLTDDVVDVYIGSVSLDNSEISFKLKRLEIHVNTNILTWADGGCQARSTEITASQNIIIAASGSLFSLILAGTSCYVAFALELHLLIKFIAVCYLAFSLWSCIYNLTPHNFGIGSADHTYHRTDGFHIKQNLKFKSLHPQYLKGIAHMKKREYAEASFIFQSIIDKGMINAEVFKSGILSYLESKQYEKALVLSDQQSNFYQLDSDDLSNKGLIFSELGNFDKSLDCYEKAIDMDANNRNPRLNRSGLFIEAGMHELALPDLNFVIERYPDYWTSYYIRGIAKLGIGKEYSIGNSMEMEGVHDLETAISLSKDDVTPYLDLCDYHFNKENFEESLQYIERAFEINPDHPDLKEHVRSYRDFNYINPWLHPISW